MRSRSSLLGRVVALLSLALGLPVLLSSARDAVVPAWAQQSSCGNAIVEAGEECDPPGSLTCPAAAACDPGCACPASPTPAVLDHFQCYEIRPPAPVPAPALTLIDRYATWTAQVSRAYTLCAPANKNGEDPSAPTHAAHLTSYGVRSTAPFAPRIADVVTQFGTHTIAVVKPKRLLVPTAKSLVALPPPLATPIDHFQCYRVKRAPGTVRAARITGVTVDTQLETGAVLDLVKPLRLCVPADKNGESPGAAQHPDQLLCFRVKSTGGIGSTHVFLTNQFEQRDYPLSQRREFCVPARPAAP